MSHRTQKVEKQLANEGSGVNFFSMQLRNFEVSNAGNEFGMMLRDRGNHKPEFSGDIVSITLSNYIHKLDWKQNVVDKKAPLVRFFSENSKLITGDIITTGQCMNYQTFSNLRFNNCSKNFLIVFTLTWQTRAWKTRFCICR